MIGLGTITAGLNPYLLYIKLAVAALAVAAIVGAGLYVRHVFNDRGRLQAENGSLEAKVKSEQEKTALERAGKELVTSQFNQYIQLNRDIADAIKKVKVTSATYIDSIEASAPPVVPDGGLVVLVPGGLPKTDPLPGVSGLSGFPNRSTARTAAGAPPG